VASLEFYVGSTLLARVPLGRGVLEHHTVGWNPSTPGVYTISAKATDSQGNTGPESTVVVTVGEVEVSPTTLPTAEPTEEIVTEETPSPSSPVPAATPIPPTREPTSIPPTRQPTSIPPTTQPTSIPPTVPPRAAHIAYFEANPSTIDEGGCSTLSWGVEYAAEVYLDGEGVVDHDTRQVCPSSTTTYSLFAKSLGGEQSASATVTVIEVPTPTPKVSIITPEPIDITPPDVSNLTADPNSIRAVGFQCGEPKTTTVSVMVSDPSGVASVVAHWTLESQSGQEDMAPYGGGLYRVELGSFSIVGSIADLRISVVARDTAGNPTSPVGPVTVGVSCLG